MLRSFEAMNISELLPFHGTDEEIAAAKIIEENRESEIEKIIFQPGFKVMAYITESGQTRVLHKSTRPGVMFQLSYIDADGIPAMHENFIETAPDHVDEAIHSKKDLIRHYSRYSNRHNLILEVITD